MNEKDTYERNSQTGKEHRAIANASIEYAVHVASDVRHASNAIEERKRIITSRDAADTSRGATASTQALR